MTVIIERFTDKTPIKFSDVLEKPQVITLGNIDYFEIKQDKKTSTFALTDICSFFVLE